MGRPIEHGAETRRRLLERAGQLLAAEGSGAITVRRLAADVGTTTRAVYSLFGSKQGLFSAMFQEGADLMVRYHEAVARSDDPLDEILPLTLAYRRAALEEPNLYGLIFERAVPGFIPTPADIEYARRSLGRVADALRRASEMGELGDRDPRAVAQQGWALVHGLASLEIHELMGPPHVAEAVWRDATTTFLAGLRSQVQEPAVTVSGARPPDRRPAGRS